MKALISVSDKTGIVELAHELVQAGFEIISTGGTANSLRQAEITTVEVSDVTKFPEILGGRVKTLHPSIFGGILYYRENPNHKSDVEKHEIPVIDWVIVNLYPFEKINLENKIPKKEMIEFIDIGGVSLLRAAAKNYESVVVLCDQKDYREVLGELKETGKVSATTRRDLASKAFAHTALYDSMISRYFREDIVPDAAGLKGQVKVNTPLSSDPSSLFPTELTLGLRKVSDLRYGENPQQKASLYKESGSREWGIVHSEKLQGKELSFNNYLDLDSAWQIVNSFNLGQSDRQPLTGSGKQLSPGHSGVCCVIVKHNNPCGVAIAPTTSEAFQMAYNADPMSAFGGIVSFSAKVDNDTAEQTSKTFFECVIAPDFTPEALETFKKKQNLRVLRQNTSLNLPFELDVKKISGGFLVQEKDHFFSADEKDNLGKKGPERDSARGETADRLGRVVTKRPPTAEEAFSLEFAWRVCKFVKSNAIVLAQGTVTNGVGAGQMSRIDSLKLAIQKMVESKRETLDSRATLASPASHSKVSNLRSQMARLPLVIASDAFFPFRDCVDECAKAGISAIVQPGSSVRDQESIDACNEHHIAMIFTGMRHFRH